MSRSPSRGWFVVVAPVALVAALIAVLATGDWWRGVDGPEPVADPDLVAEPSAGVANAAASPVPDANQRQLARGADGGEAIGVRVQRDGQDVAGARVVWMPESWSCRLFAVREGKLVRVNTLPASWSTSHKQGDFELLGVTDDSGWCALPPGAGGLAVAVFDPEQQQVQSRWQCVGQRAGLQRDVVIPLRATRRLAARAIDAASGAPVPAAMRLLAAAGAETGDGDALYVLEREAERGQLATPVAAGVPMVLLCECAGYEPQLQVVPAADGDVELEVSMRDAGSIRGRVVTEAGVAVPGAAVQGASGFLGTGRSSCTSGPDGTWSIAARGSAFRITARKTGFVEATVDGVQRGQRDVEIVLQRVPCRALQGRVLRDDRTPAVGVAVEAWPLDQRRPPPEPHPRMGRNPPLAEARTDASGRFSFEQLPLGDYAFDVRPTPRPEHDGTASVTNLARHTLADDGAAAFVELQLPPLGEIVLSYPSSTRERLLRDQPATRLPIVLLKRVFGEKKLVSVVVAELPVRGPLRFGGLVAGHYVVLTNPKSEPVHRELAPGASLSMSLAMPHDRAQVTVERQGTPLRGCRVSYLDVRSERVSHATTDDHGRVALAVPTAGDGVVRLEAADGAVAVVRSQLSPLRGNLIAWPLAGVEVGLAEPVDARFDGSGTVRVEALEVEGVGLPRAVKVAEVQVDDLRTLAAQAVAVDGLSPGSYRITILRGDEAERTGEVRVAGPARTRTSL